MSTVDNPNSVMYVPPVLRAARRLVFQTGIKALPQSVPLEQIAIIEMGQSPEGNSCSNTPDGVPLLNGPTEFGDIHPTPVQWTSDPRKFAETGDLLFCVRGATAGRTNWADQPYAIGRGLCAIRGKQHCGDTYFIYHMLRDRRDALADQAHGSTFMNLSKQELHQLAIPQMTVEMQHALGDFLSSVEHNNTNYEYWHNVFVDTPFADTVRIVARVEALAGRVAEAQRLRAEAMAEAEAILTSAKDQLFNLGPLQQYTSFTLGEIADIRAGVTLGRRDITGPTIHLPYLRVANVQDGYLDLEDIKDVEIKEIEYDKWQLEAGDIVLTEGGDWDKLGRGTVWQNEIPTCIHQNHIFRLRVDHTKFDPYYLMAMISSPYGKSYFQSSSKQTTNLASINQRQLKAFVVFKPPLSEQQRIISYLNQIQDKVKELRNLQTATEVEIDSMLPAILDKAFRGEW